MAAIGAGSTNGTQCETYGLLQVANSSRKGGVAYFTLTRLRYSFSFFDYFLLPTFSFSYCLELLKAIETFLRT